MARFGEILNQFGDAEGLPDGMLEAFMSAYDEDISVPLAKVDQIAAERDELALKVQNLKTQNYDLTYGGAGNVPGAAPANNTPNLNDDENPNVTIEDLFK